MADDHVAVPKLGERSVVSRKSKEHQTNCAGWVNSKKPWPSNAHHILPVTCFNPIDVNPKDKLAYVKRCVAVSQWNINGGNKFAISGDDNNMVSLPLFSAYNNAYPATAAGKFRRAVYPVNQCMHNSRYSEHHIYIKEVKEYLQSNIWANLQEDKQKHKLKGKSVLAELKAGSKHFRDQLVTRGARATQNGNSGTIQCWQNKSTDTDEWMLPFSMASDGATLYPI